MSIQNLIFGALGIVFVILKLLGITAVANWSWWWVTAPFWGGSALAMLILVCMVTYTLVRTSKR